MFDVHLLTLRLDDWNTFKLREIVLDTIIAEVNLTHEFLYWVIN